MKIALGADHGGVGLKDEIAAHLKALGHEVQDYGTYTADSCSYPVYAEKVCRAVVGGAHDTGILVCGTGIGMSLAANKIKGIRAAVVGDSFTAKLTRQHNDANILCLGARVVGPGLALMIVDDFIGTAFEGGRHQTRIDMVHDIENRGE